MHIAPHLKCFQFFIFLIILGMTSDPIYASLKKGTTACILSDVPNSGKLISRKHVCPKSGLSHAGLAENIPYDVPNLAKLIPRKHVCRKSGLSHAGLAENIPSDVPNSGKPFPGKHVCPKSALLHKDFRHFGAQMCIFLLGVFDIFLFL